MTEYKIEKGVPLPARAGSVRGGLMSAVRAMEVGDSLFAAGKKASNVSGTGRVVGQRMKDGRNYTVRTVKGGVRIWRIK